MKTKLMIGLIVLAVALFCAAQTGVARARPLQEDISIATAGRTGTRMPNFCLNDLEGRPVCSSQFHGKTLLIDFWASWCGPCKTEMPAYEKFQERYGSQGFVVIGIGLSMDTPVNLKKFAQRLGIHYILLMGTMEVQNKFGLKGIPTTILVDKNGMIRRRVVGFDYPSKFVRPIQRVL
ncbi:MAG: TlpA disulfide reductase family protein [Candidatus Acidiferrales bacterium]